MTGGRSGGLDEAHICFGCQKQLLDGELHIHVPMDEWSAIEGLSPIGLDDILTMVFCESCTERTPRQGWHLTSHGLAP